MMRAIQMMCNCCGASIFVEKNAGFSQLACPYCNGSMTWMMDSEKVKIARIKADTERLGMEYSYKRHRDHLVMDWVSRNSRAILIGFAVLVILSLIMSSTAKTAAKNKDNIKVPFSSRSLDGKAYRDVRLMFIDAGFSDIEMIAREDLWDGLFHNDQGNVGKVAQVTINGDESFGENESFNKYSKIRIWYHSYP